MDTIKIAELEIGYTDLLKAQAELADSIRATKESTTELLEEQKKLRDEGRAGTQQYDRNAKAIEENKVVLSGLNTEYRNNEKVLTSSVAAQNDSMGTIQKLQAENAKLRINIRGLNLDTEEGRKKQKEYITQVNKNTELIRKNSDAYVQQKMNIGNYKSAFDLLPPSLQKGAQGFQTIGNAAKMFIANPVVLAIVAIVAVIATLVKAFKNTEDGGDRVKKKFDQLKAAIGVVMERIENFALGLAKVFSGEQKLKDLKGTFKGMGDEMQRDVRLAGELADMMDQLEDKEIDMITISAERKASIDKLKEAAADQNKTEAERVRLMREAQVLIDEEAKAQQGLLLTKIANELATTDEAKVLDRLNQLRKEGKQITLEELGLGNATNVDRKRANELIAQYIGLEEQAATEKRRNTSAISGLVKKQVEEQTKAQQEAMDIMDAYYSAQAQMYLDDVQAAVEAERKKAEEKLRILQEAKDKEKAWDEEMAIFRQEKALTDAENLRIAREAEMNDRFQAELDALKRDEDAEIASALKTGASVSAIVKKFAAIEKQIERDKQVAKLEITQSFAGAISELLGKETAAGKAAAIIQTVINTYKGAMSAFAETPGGIVIKSIAAGTAIATGVAAVRNIMKTGGGSGGASGSISDIAGTASAGVQASAAPATNYISAMSEQRPVLVIEEYQRVAAGVAQVKAVAQL